jgi:hypothetical protein
LVSRLKLFPNLSSALALNSCLLSSGSGNVLRFDFDLAPVLGLSRVVKRLKKFEIRLKKARAYSLSPPANQRWLTPSFNPNPNQNSHPNNSNHSQNNPQPKL